MSTIEEAREQARETLPGALARLVENRLGKSLAREADKDMIALRAAANAIVALLDAIEPPEAQEAAEPMRDANGDMISSGEHRKISMSGDSFFVCDTCTNVLGLNVRWDHASKREDHQAAVESLPDKPAEDEREALVMTLYANGLAGNLHEPLRRQAVEKWADAILADGYSKGPRPITDEMVEAAAGADFEFGKESMTWDAWVAHDSDHAGWLRKKARAALEAAEEARR